MQQYVRAAKPAYVKLRHTSPGRKAARSSEWPDLTRCNCLTQVVFVLVIAVFLFVHLRAGRRPKCGMQLEKTKWNADACACVLEERSDRAGEGRWPQSIPSCATTTTLDLAPSIQYQYQAHKITIKRTSTSVCVRTTNQPMYKYFTARQYTMIQNSNKTKQFVNPGLPLYAFVRGYNSKVGMMRQAGLNGGSLHESATDGRIRQRVHTPT
jgi:hypothetical protein